MISLIYGGKGTGKTKMIMDSANKAIEQAKGTIIYITDKAKHSKELSYNIRFVDSAEYGIACEACLTGFIKGILASDNDIEKVYIDGLARMAGKDCEALEGMYKTLEDLSKKDEVDFCLTVSCAELPEYLKQYEQTESRGC